ncbi:MAG: GNAT family N-acetyltransferase [Anaerotignum sp.]|nr:GNAT family N-acetyltransferase [Anaerotignum sp.]
MTKNMNYTIRPYKAGEEDYVADAHARVYGEEYNWSDIFIAFAKQVVYDYAALPKSDHAEMWVADVDGQPVGSIMLQEEETGLGHLRLFILEKEYRGTGIADALLNTAMEHARKWGFSHLYLSTAEPLTAARKKYAKLGFAITRIEEMDDWTKDGSIIKEEFWEMDL